MAAPSPVNWVELLEQLRTEAQASIKTAEYPPEIQVLPCGDFTLVRTNRRLESCSLSFGIIDPSGKATLAAWMEYTSGENSPAVDARREAVTALLCRRWLTRFVVGKQIPKNPSRFLGIM